MEQTKDPISSELKTARKAEPFVWPAPPYYVNLERFSVAQEVLDKISGALAHRFKVMPLCVTDGALVVATENPASMSGFDEIRFASGMRLVPVKASATDIRSAIARHYGAAGKSPMHKSASYPVSGESVLDRRASAPSAPEMGIDELTSRLAAESTDQELSEHQLEHSDSTLVKLVNKVILDAVERKVSDIHIESNSGQRGTRVRFRKDGTLIDYLELPARFQRAVISRIKIMSQLDITERRKPQDGKIDFGHFGPAQVELRVATIPTRDSLEDVVMRLLGASNRVPIAELGFDADVLASLRRLISRPLGLFLVCGPTGSGKTTTLHSLLGVINTAQRKIWTAEDPIEITQAGLRQVQVNSKIGWTFAAAMRSFLRADPDVIMVGEMRDAETAKVGIEASLTGHLVLSTLHTNSAIECIIRLLDLGMDPFNFSDALLGVLAQRLAKRLCPACKVKYVPAEDELRELAEEYCIDTQLDPGTTREGWVKRDANAGELAEEYCIDTQLDPGATRKGWDTQLDPGTTRKGWDTQLDPGATRRGWGRRDAGGGGVSLWRAAGCERCDRTGYVGRMGLFELLVADPKVKRLVQSKAPMSDLKDAATAMGMRTLKQDGIERVLQGLTDMHQVRAVCG